MTAKAIFKEKLKRENNYHIASQKKRFHKNPSLKYLLISFYFRIFAAELHYMQYHNRKRKEITI